MDILNFNIFRKILLYFRYNPFKYIFIYINAIDTDVLEFLVITALGKFKITYL